MIIFSTPFRGQQVLTPLGSEQTTSLLVVLIVWIIGKEARREKRFVYRTLWCKYMFLSFPTVRTACR